MRNLIFSLLHNLGMAHILRKFRVKNREISVLMFHRISDEIDLLWPPTPIKIFRSLMKELSRRATVVPLEKIEQIEQYPKSPLVALSFDDGYFDFWRNALPILYDFKLPAHHNICPRLIDQGKAPWTQLLNRFLQSYPNQTVQLPDGKTYRIKKEIDEKDFLNICRELYFIDNELRNDWINSWIGRIPESESTRLMNWQQIKECAKLGIHIGSHGVNHLNMSQIEDRDILLVEIKESKRRIKEEIGAEPLIFAFPNGLYNSLSIQMLWENGYKIALLCGDTVSRFTGNREQN